MLSVREHSSVRQYESHLDCRYAAGTGRRGPELPDASGGQPEAARPARSPAKGHPRHRLEGTVADVPALQASGSRWQGEGRGHDRHRPRDGRLHLGHRQSSDGVSSLTSLPRLTRSAQTLPMHKVGDGTRWGTLVPVMSRSDRRSPLERGSPRTKLR